MTLGKSAAAGLKKVFRVASYIAGDTKVADAAALDDADVTAPPTVIVV